MRFLDNVLDDFIAKAPDSMERAKYAALRERSVGLGVMGFHSFLQSQGVPIESASAKAWNRNIFRHVRGHADAASRALAAERGPCPDASDYGFDERFSNKLAIAPTASISIICGGLVAGHRTQRRQRLHPQDAVGLVQRAQQVPEGASGREGAGHRRRLDLDHRQRGLGRPSRLPER